MLSPTKNVMPRLLTAGSDPSANPSGSKFADILIIKDPLTPIDSFTITAEARAPQEVHADPGAVKSD